ncbi:MAG: ABC transporter transmembrane domain-containing protein [Gammaproteobacteria bacterium]|nr:ABC transporter transmembrane domain-containing protein [Gammaproteobacteria bacterium]
MPERQSSRNIASLKQMLSFLRPYGPQLIVAATALVATATVTLSVGQGLRLLIDDVLTTRTQDVLLVSIGVFAALVVLLAAGTYARYYFVSWVGERVSADIRKAVYANLIRLHPGFFETNRPTEIMSRITTDTTLLQTVLGTSASIALRNSLILVGGIVMLFVTNPKLSTVVLASAPVVISPIVLFGRRVRRLSRTSQTAIADVGSYAGESLRHIKVVQAFTHEARDIEAFAGRVTDAFDVAVQRIRQRAVLIASVMVLTPAAIAAMLWVGGTDVLAGRTTAGELIAFIFYALVVAGSATAISEVWADVQRAAGAAERLLELLTVNSLLAEPECPETPTELGAIRFDNVYLRYPARSGEVALNGVDLRVAPGEMVALVGPSGSGKSSILDLVQRFYDPTEGVVSVSGVDARRLSAAVLRGQVGFVPQNPVVFAGPIMVNVLYGAPDAKEEEIRSALEQANALEFVEGLENDLHTCVGEDGQGLSGGQRQRLAIARALLTSPRILLMDEPTSALDAQSEETICRTLASIKGRCTVLIVAHRLSTAAVADRIVVLDEGRVIAEGSHDSLLRENGLYREFAEIQRVNGADVR